MKRNAITETVSEKKSWEAGIEEFDHRTDLSDRYYEESKSMYFEKARQNYHAGAEGSRDPEEQLAGSGPDIHSLAFAEKEKEESELMLSLLEAMKHLTPQQVDLIYDFYGMSMGYQDIATRDGVSRQAVNNRMNKLHRKLKKLMKEQGVDISG